MVCGPARLAGHVPFSYACSRNLHCPDYRAFPDDPFCRTVYSAFKSWTHHPRSERVAMNFQKSRPADLKRHYRISLEAGMILALLVLILAFRAGWTSETSIRFEMKDQELVVLDEIEQTRHVEEPPPPPRPPVPIEVPDADVPDDVHLDLGSSLDIDQPLWTAPPSPPPPPAPAREPEPDVFVIVEEMPELIGGIEGLYRQLRYPETARRAGLEGRVVLEFIVDEEGRVTFAEIVQDPGAGLGEEALRVIQMARFTPGRQRNQPVRVRVRIGIFFRLVH
jgi:periplasmic protein TonB